MTLAERAHSLKRFVGPGITAKQLQQCTNFAIDALEANQTSLAIELLTPLTSWAPRSALVWQLLGLAHRANANSADAYAALSKAAALAPHDARIVAGQAVAAYEAGYPSALLFKSARDLTPNDPELLLSTANALTADGYADVAETVLAQNVAANPSWIRGHEALASLRWTLTKPDDFARSFADAVAAQPNNLALRIAWQRTLAQAGKWEAAADVIAAGRELLGARPEFDAVEAHLATETGDDQRASRLFEKALVVDDPSTRISHIRHCLRVKDIERAAAIAEPMMTTPASARAFPYLGLVWRLTNDDRARWLDGEPPMIGIYDLPFQPGALDALAAHLRSLHRTRFHPTEQSLRGGTQTEGDLFTRADPELVEVRALVREAVRTFVDALPPPDSTHPLLGPQRDHLRFAGSWSVRLSGQGFHICHTHPLGWISSALYVSIPDVTSLGDPPAGWLELGAPPNDLRLDLPPYQRIDPQPGRLVLFPSTMWHGTMPFSDGERLTIAFDIAKPS